MSFQVPNEFQPQTHQTISSQQVDENNDYLTTALNTLQSQVGTGGGARTINTKDTYTLRPQYGGSAVPTGTEFVDRKYLDATRGCRIGDLIFTLNPNALPNDYGVVWAQIQGQQLSKTTYPDCYAFLQSIGGLTAGQYNPDTGATAGNFVMPDARGCALAALLGASSNLPSTVPNVANANNPGSVVGEGNHVMTLAELVTHHHPTFIFSPSGSAIASNGSSNANVATTTGDTGSSAAFNIVQKTFMMLAWMRIA